MSWHIKAIVVCTDFVGVGNLLNAVWHLTNYTKMVMTYRAKHLFVCRILLSDLHSNQNSENRIIGLLNVNFVAKY